MKKLIFFLLLTPFLAFSQEGKTSQNKHYLAIGGITGIDIARTSTTGSLGATFDYASVWTRGTLKGVLLVGLDAEGANLGQDNLFRPSLHLEGGIVFKEYFMLSLLLKSGVNIFSLSKGLYETLKGSFDLSFSLGFSGLIPLENSFLSIGTYLGYEFSNLFSLASGLTGLPYFGSIGHFHWEILSVRYFI